MLDTYLNDLDSCKTTQQIDALANKAFENLNAKDFKVFIDKAVDTLDRMLDNITMIKHSRL